MILLKSFIAKSLRFMSRILDDLAELLFIFSYRLYPWTALNKIDFKIAKELPNLLNSNTFYIEVGANNGIRQSNTYFLEALYGANGLLIEASPTNYEKCLKYRSKKNLFEHCALVSFDYKLPFLELIYSDLMTISKDAKSLDPELHAKDGLKFLNGNNYNFFAPAKTLSKVCEDKGIKTIDLLSIDIEGYELEALKGIKFDSFLIKNIIIESRNIEEIKEYLFQNNYYLKKKLTYHDYLFCKLK